MTTQTTRPFEALAGTLGDRFLTSDHPTYAAASQVTFAGPAPRPLAIARPIEVSEVVATLRAVRSSGLPLVVRGGGHSFARASAGDGAVVLDTRLLDGVRIDPERRIAVAGGGVSAGAYTAAVAPHGLATGFGDTASVGVAGLTLGGGMGHLSRRDGLTIDSLLSAEVVLSDGTVVVADESNHADLFWGLRGGGGNFGVVTELRFRLAPTSLVTGGLLVFPADPTTYSGLVEAATAAPDVVSSMVNVLKAPPAPFLPSELHGRPVVAVVVCHSGDPDRAATDLAPFRTAGVAVVDMVAGKPYPAMFEGAPRSEGLFAAARTGFVDVVTEAWAAEAIGLVGAAPSGGAIVNTRIMGGAIARPAADATAFGHRARAASVTVVAQDPRPVDGLREWTDSAHAALALGEGSYVNFMSEHSVEAARSAYPPGTLERLRAVKRSYDAAGMFSASVPLPS